MVEGLAIVKRRRSEGSIAKSLTIEIVLVVFALFSDNARAFLQECQCVGFLAAGHLRTWATPRRWAIARSRARCAAWDEWAKIGLDFSWKIEIAFHL